MAMAAEHLGRWCVVDEEPMMTGDVAYHPIRASFGERHWAEQAVMVMNRDIRRWRVKVMHYYFPTDEA